MAQAKRRAPKKPKSVDAGHTLQALAMLIAGMVIGSLATILWQGMQENDAGVGTGIREMIEQSKQAEIQQQVAEPEAPKPEKQETTFDFFTVLPEIEVVVPEQPKPEPEVTGSQPQTDSPEVSVAAVEENPTSAFMLQAGSYQRASDAERLKASLALNGLVSTIQKVTIQGRGDFYRVRLGPYYSHSEMVTVDQQLGGQGIKALRLKVSREP